MEEGRVAKEYQNLNGMGIQIIVEILAIVRYVQGETKKLDINLQQQYMAFQMGNTVTSSIH